MIIHPSFILSQGKHKGYSLSEIYQYDPTYINWMVEFIQGFEINIDEFYNLPKPNVSVPPVNKTKVFSIESFYRTSPNASVADLKQAKYLTEIDFKFSEQTIKILSEKKNGTYIAPKWEYAINGDIISFDDIKNLDKVTMEKTNDQDQLTLLKSLIPEFGKRPISDLYQPSQKYSTMYSQAYASVNSILLIVDETNISKYQRLNVVLKSYITLADLIFNTQFKTEQQLGQLQDKLTDILTVLTQL